ncbi:MAG: hypothetical protein JXB04_12515 [Kiritimatiellae bacterium]|nr:hypothetical protein [Kiritimatiellia bacterium]
MTSKKGGGIRSAFDLAMERLEKKGGSVARLSEEQKREFARVESEARAKIAEIEIMMGQQVAAARAAGDAEKLAQIEEQKVTEIRRIMTRAEDEKERLRAR